MSERAVARLSSVHRFPASGRCKAPGAVVRSVHGFIPHMNRRGRSSRFTNRCAGATHASPLPAGPPGPAHCMPLGEPDPLCKDESPDSGRSRIDSHERNENPAQPGTSPCGQPEQRRSFVACAEGRTMNAAGTAVRRDKSEANPRTTSRDVLDATAHRVAEIVDGTLYTQPRPAVPHARASSSLGVKTNPTPPALRNPPGWASPPWSSGLVRDWARPSAPGIYQAGRPLPYTFRRSRSGER